MQQVDMMQQRASLSLLALPVANMISLVLLVAMSM